LVLCRVRRYRDRHPTVTDIYLVVGVADTTLDFGLADKRALYSAAGIAEYWVIDVQGKKLIRFLRDGKEQPVTSTKISPAIFPDLNIDLAELFG
jgi:Uma2 family endonuclease